MASTVLSLVSASTRRFEAGEPQLVAGELVQTSSQAAVNGRYRTRRASERYPRGLEIRQAFQARRDLRCRVAQFLTQTLIDASTTGSALGPTSSLLSTQCKAPLATLVRAALPSKMVASPPLPTMASAAAVAQRFSARRGRRSWARWVYLTNGDRKIGISLQLRWLTGERKSYSGTARSVDANAHTMCYVLRGFHARSRESWPRRRASSDAVLVNMNNLRFPPFGEIDPEHRAVGDDVERIRVAVITPLDVIAPAGGARTAVRLFLRAPTSQTTASTKQANALSTSTASGPMPSSRWRTYWPLFRPSRKAS